MATEDPKTSLQINYEEAAQEYLRSLTMEQIMEATPQATQREITLESLALVRAQRADFKVFNELLVQYPLQGKKRPGQVVPDNMVVLHDGPMQVHGSYDVPDQPTGPFWVLEYVSKSNKRKDYDDNVRKYEHELQVPYYLLFAPEAQELTLYRMVREKYVTVLPNERGRYAIPELELELAILEGWVRYWYRGELLPLPPEWWRERSEMLAQMEKQELQVEQTRTQKEEAERRADAERSQKEEAQRRTEEVQRQADAERSQKQEAQRRAEEVQRQVDAERSQKQEAQRRTEEVQRQADAERSQKQEAERRAEQAQRRAEESQRQADAERESRLAFESEMASLRAELAQLRRQTGHPQ